MDPHPIVCITANLPSVSKAQALCHGLKSCYFVKFAWPWIGTQWTLHGTAVPQGAGAGTPRGAARPDSPTPCQPLQCASAAGTPDVRLPIPVPAPDGGQLPDPRGPCILALGRCSAVTKSFSHGQTGVLPAAESWLVCRCRPASRGRALWEGTAPALCWIPSWLAGEAFTSRRCGSSGIEERASRGNQWRKPVGF